MSLLDLAIETVARARAPKEPPTPAGPSVEGAPSMERPTCPVCGATRSTPVVTSSDTWVADGPSAQSPFAAVRCGVCASRYTTPRYRRQFRHLAFSGAYPFYTRARRAQDGNGEDVEAAAKLFASRAKVVGDACPRAGRLLDVGCGDGLFTHVMRRRGWDVVGVDVEPDVIWHATERLGLDARPVDVESEALPDGPFDVVTMWGLLQLMYEPQRALERVHDVLADRGMLAIGVSNIGALGARMFRGHWRGLGVPRHLVHFTPATLRRLLEAAGFDVLDIRYETPRWITAGSLDAMVSGPGPLMKVARTTVHAMGQLVASTPLAETMIVLATPSLNHTDE